MKQSTFLFFFLLMSIFGLQAQNDNVGIGTTSPDASALLELNSNNKGILIPRVEQGSVTSPAKGLLIFQNSDASFYYYNGFTWIRLGSDGIVDFDGDTKVTAKDGLLTDSIFMEVNGNPLVNFRSNTNADVIIDLKSKNNSTFIGEQSGFSSTGANNTAVGSFSLNANQGGSQNTAIGSMTLKDNNLGFSNVAVGHKSMQENIGGSNNVAVGPFSLNKNNGSQNVAIGSTALTNNVDGGFNTAVGQSAMALNSSGNWNTTIGYKSLLLNTSGSMNTAIGHVSLENNTTQSQLVAVGDSSLYSNTTGEKNTAVGSRTLKSNVDGKQNSAIGYKALSKNISGDANTAFGNEALTNNTTGDLNTAIGNFSMLNNTTGIQNTAIGSQTLNNNDSGERNVAVGRQAMFSNINGRNNTAIGNEALFENEGGLMNTAVGNFALNNSETGSGGVAVGNYTLYSNINLSDLVAVGDSALYSNTTGARNTAVGAQSLMTNNIGADNVAFGYNALMTNGIARSNSAFGSKALMNNTEGENNVAVGKEALKTNTTGFENIAIGSESLLNNEQGRQNVAIGNQAMKSNENGFQNTVVGIEAMAESNDGTESIAIGYQSLKANNGSLNLAVGTKALSANTTGGSNLAVGNNSLNGNLMGANNMAVGNEAGFNATGSNNLFLGNGAGSSFSGSDKLFIEQGSGDSNIALIYGDFQNDFLRINNQLGVGRNVSIAYGLTLKAISAVPTPTATSPEGLVKFYDRNDGETWHMRLQNGGDLGFTESGVLDDRLVLEKGGNIGMGIADPETNLHIKSGTSPTLKLQSGGNSEESGRVSLRQDNNSGIDMFYDGTNGIDELVFESYQGLTLQGPIMKMNQTTREVKLAVTNTIADGDDLVIASDGTIGKKKSYAAGDVAFGGVVFWVDESGEHGLVVALDEFFGPWVNTASPESTYATADGIKAGIRNTTLIIMNSGGISNAGRTCADYSGGVYGDWYLPSLAELSKIHDEFSLVNSVLNGLQGAELLTQGANYWSSLEDSETQAKGRFLSSGLTVTKSKSISDRIRPIRAF